MGSQTAVVTPQHRIYESGSSSFKSLLKITYFWRPTMTILFNTAYPTALSHSTPLSLYYALEYLLFSEEASLKNLDGNLLSLLECKLHESRHLSVSESVWCLAWS